MMRRALAVIFFAAVLAVPAQASALTVAPPGHAGSDQYFETVPTSSGNAAPPGGPAAGKGADRSIDRLGHSRAALRKLSHMGTEGQAAASLAASTAPGATGSATGASGKGSGIGLAPASQGLSQPQGEGAASGLASALTGSDGLGWILPFGLLAAFLAALLLAVARLRRGSEPPDATA